MNFDEQLRDRIQYANMRVRRLKEKIKQLEGWLNEPERVKDVRKAIRSSKVAIARWEKIIMQSKIKQGGT